MLRKITLGLCLVAASAATATAVEKEVTIPATKATIASDVKTYLAKKDKDFATREGTFDALTLGLCEASEALSCHAHRLSEIKRKRRAVKTMTIFAEGCDASGGKHRTSDNFSSGDGVKSYFNSQPFKFSNRSFEKRDMIVGCWRDSKPELFLRVISVEPVVRDPNELSGKLLGEKTKLYFMVLDGEKLAPKFESAQAEIVVAAQNNETARNEREACMAIAPQVGEETNKGLLIELNGKVAQVQGRKGVEWVKTESLKKSYSEC